MDKRWIAIIIILVIGLGCMSYVVITSTTVGHAVTIVDDLAITLPHGFKIAHSETGQTTLIDDRSNETIFIKYLRDGNRTMKEYVKEMKSLSENDNIEILGNSSQDGIHGIYCHDLKNDKNYSMYYTEKFDRTILIKMENFKNRESEDEQLDYMITTIKPDYKQSRS